MRKRILPLFLSFALLLASIQSAQITAIALATPNSIKIECESYNDWSKGKTDFTDTNNLRVISETERNRIEGTSNGAWLCYNNIDFGDGCDTISVFQASNSARCCADSRLEVRLGSTTGELIATVRLPYTSSINSEWNKYNLEKTKLNRTVEGTQNIYIVMRGTDDLTTNPVKNVIANLDYFVVSFDAKYRDPLTQNVADKINALPNPSSITVYDGQEIKSAFDSLKSLSEEEQNKMTEEKPILDLAIANYLNLDLFAVTEINQPKSATYIGGKTITLIAPIEYDLYYTTDGSPPTLSSAATKKIDKNTYSQINITETTTVKTAVNTILGLAFINTETYTITLVPAIIPVKNYKTSYANTINVGNSTSIKITDISPSDATDKTVTYKSLNKFARVSSSGKVTGLSAGLAKIQVKVGSITKTVNIKIKSYATAIKMKTTAIKVKKGKKSKSLENYFSVTTPKKEFYIKTIFSYKESSKYITIKNGIATVSKNAKKGKVTINIYNKKTLLGKLTLQIV